MGQLTAQFFRSLFKIDFFKNKYYGFHKHIFSKYDLFKNVSTQITYRDNILLNVRLNDWIQQQLYFLGDYEKSEIDYLYQTLKKDDVFIDIGANIGLFSLNAAKIVGENGQVYAFEALPQNYEHCLAHIKINSFKNITLENLAISDKEGFIEMLFNEDDNNVGMASAYLKNYSSKEKVKCINIDDYIANLNLSRIDLIKLDIEGGEYNALLGMEEALYNFSPKILIEINDETLQNSNTKASQLLELLSKFGYKQQLILSKDSQSYNAIFAKTIV